ncbi:MAG: protein kinase [Archangiaceae bacterium]|nr:protein kinase [Archangiaceae bacterium]
MNRRAGKYQLLERRGSGVIGTVYRARDLQLDRDVALKLLHPRLATNPATLELLRAEMRTAALLSSPHVASVLEVGSLENDGSYVATEWLAGVPLSQRLGRPLGAALVVAICRQICAALQAAHQHGLVHRDLKPDNVFLLEGEPRGSLPMVKVVDFGLTRVLKPRSGSPRTPSGQICASPHYMAPELCVGGRVDGRTDLYALGIIAYELATGRVPFDGRNLVEVMMRQRSERPVAPCEVEPSVPRALSDVIMRALEKQRDERFATAVELGDALAHVRAGAAPTPQLDAEVRCPGQPPRPARCTQLLSGGVFLSTADAPPAIGAPVEVVLRHCGLTISCACEVTLHVRPEQSAAWGTPEGFAARFTALSPAAQTLVDRLLRGEPLPRTPADPGGAAAPVDPFEEDLYTLLGVSAAADAAAIRRRARALKVQLEDAVLVSGATAVRDGLLAQLTRVDGAARLLCDPSLRLEYDVARGNFLGVALSLEAGLEGQHVEALRRRHAEANPDAMARALAHQRNVQSHLAAGAKSRALAECELALRLDPLSAGLHALRGTLRAAIEGEPETLSGEWRVLPPRPTA